VITGIIRPIPNVSKTIYTKKV